MGRRAAEILHVEKKLGSRMLLLPLKTGKIVRDATSIGNPRTSRFLHRNQVKTKVRRIPKSRTSAGQKFGFDTTFQCTISAQCSYITSVISVFKGSF